MRHHHRQARLKVSIRLKAPLLPLVRLLVRAGVHPNLITVLGALGAVAACLIIASGSLTLGAGLLLLASLFDTLDGEVARASGKITSFGAFLDSTTDRIAEAALFGALVWLHRAEQWTVLLLFGCFFLSLMVSYVRARGEGAKSVVASVGPASRAVRLVLMVLILVLPAGWFFHLMAGFGLLTLFTLVRRVAYLYRAA